MKDYNYYYYYGCREQGHSWFTLDTISRMVCECGLTPTLSTSKSDKDYGKMYLRCPQRNCDLFQWWLIIVTDVCGGKHVLAGKFDHKKRWVAECFYQEGPGRTTAQTKNFA